MALIKTLVDRAYQIKNTGLGFHQDITERMDILRPGLNVAFYMRRIKY